MDAIKMVAKVHFFVVHVLIYGFTSFETMEINVQTDTLEFIMHPLKDLYFYIYDDRGSTPTAAG